ncbi:MAG: thiamine-phosphate kinase [Flavobacteriaceae bacterium]
MFEDKNPSHTPLEKLGEFGLIEYLTKSFHPKNESTVLGIGDDAAVIDHNQGKSLLSTDLLLEGIHFDLSYVPLKHLGYKSVVVNLSDIYAMGGQPTQITVSVGVSNRFPVEALAELYKGIHLACQNYQVDLIGGDTSSSKQGLIISVTAVGYCATPHPVQRSGAKSGDLLLVSGDLGAAYMGLQVLEREKAVFEVNPQNQPDLSDYAYCVGRQLKPEARKDVLELLKELEIQPTAMIDISDGLSSEVLHLCKSSNLGCALYEDKIPMDPEMLKLCDEFKLPNTTAALEGGEDYELLLSISPKDYAKLKDHPFLSPIGHFKPKEEGVHLITGLGQQIELTAQGWKNFKD